MDELERLKNVIRREESRADGENQRAEKAERERDKLAEKLRVLPWDGEQEAIHLFHRERESRASMQTALEGLVAANSISHGKRSERNEIRQKVKRNAVADALAKARQVLPEQPDGPLI